MRRRSALVLVSISLAGCTGEIGELPEQPLNELGASLSVTEKRSRSDQIKAAAAAKGITNALLVAGIAHHESGLAQCWSEASWHCQGPWSSDCNGPALAGSGDGPCSWQQGGIGMFQLDAGTFSQTLGQYGADVVNVAGNVAGGVDVIVHKVKVCPNTPNFATTQQVIDFINGAKPGTAEYETFITAMAWCYNGCDPSYTSCNHNAVRNAYKEGVESLLATFGEDYWYGGVVSSSLARPAKRVGVNSDGRLEAFVRGTDRAIWHKWQLWPNSDFSEWSSLDGVLDGDPVAGSNADGRLEIFAVGQDGALWHRWQLDSGWGEWTSLGGAGLIGEPAVGTNADGRLEVIVRSSDGQLWHKWQLAPSSDWVGEWHHFALDATSDAVIGKNADGRLEAFVQGGDQALWHRWQLWPNGSWSEWSSLGGVLVAEPAIGTNADGRLEAFHVGTDGTVYHRWQLGDGSWGDWVSLGAVGIVGEPAVAQNLDGRLELFIRSWDGQLWHKWQLAPNGEWSPDWYHFGVDTSSDPELARNAAGQLELFVRGGDASLWHRWQIAPNSSWGDWAPLGGELESY